MSFDLDTISFIWDDTLLYYIVVFIGRLIDKFDLFVFCVKRAVCLTFRQCVRSLVYLHGVILLVGCVV